MQIWELEKFREDECARQYAKPAGRGRVLFKAGKTSAEQVWQTHEYRLSYSTGGGGKVAEKTLDLRLALSGNLGTPDTEELKGKEVIRKKTGLIK